MLSRLDVEDPRECRSFESSETFKDWNIKRAKGILKAGEAHFGGPLEQLIENCYNDWTRTSIAWAVWSETSVSHASLAEHLNMKSAANSSQQIRRFAQVDEKGLPAKIKKCWLTLNSLIQSRHRLHKASFEIEMATPTNHHHHLLLHHHRKSRRLHFLRWRRVMRKRTSARW